MFYAIGPPVCLPRNLIRLPLVRQGTNWTCGVSAAQSLLRYLGPEFDYREDSLAGELKADSTNGTSYPNIVAFAQSKGLIVTIREELTLQDVITSIDKRIPLMVAYQAWDELEEGKSRVEYADKWDGHWSLLCGYDEKNFFFMDPSTLGTYGYVPYEEFMVRWHDEDGPSKRRLHHWAMSICKPDNSNEDKFFGDYAQYIG